MVAKRVGVESMTLRKMIKDGPRLQAAMDETFEIAVDEAVGVPEFWGEVVDSDAKCNPVDSIGSSTKSRVSHSERRPSAQLPGDEDGSARRNIEPLQ